MSLIYLRISLHPKMHSERTVIGLNRTLWFSNVWKSNLTLNIIYYNILLKKWKNAGTIELTGF